MKLNIDAPYPVEMKDLENGGSSASFVCIHIDNILDPK